EEDAQGEGRSTAARHEVGRLMQVDVQARRERDRVLGREPAPRQLREAPLHDLSCFVFGEQLEFGDSHRETPFVRSGLSVARPTTGPPRYAVRRYAMSHSIASCNGCASLVVRCASDSQRKEATPMKRLIFLVLTTALLVFAASAAAGRSSNVVGAAYTISNAASGNALVVYDRTDDGALAYAGSVS